MQHAVSNALASRAECVEDDVAYLMSPDVLEQFMSGHERETWATLSADLKRGIITDLLHDT